MTTFVRPTVAAFSILLLGALAQPVTAAAISFTGDLRTDATFTDCGSGCTLGPGNTNGEYAQYAAVVRTFNVASTSLMQGITFSYGGGINGAGTTILEGGLEPYLTLFDSGGHFVASTFSGTTCPPGASCLLNAEHRPNYPPSPL